jgi:hypothetical protein
MRGPEWRSTHFATFVDRERRLKTLFPQGIRTDRHLFE